MKCDGAVAWVCGEYSSPYVLSLIRSFRIGGRGGFQRRLVRRLPKSFIVFQPETTDQDRDADSPSSETDSPSNSLLLQQVILTFEAQVVGADCFVLVDGETEHEKYLTIAGLKSVCGMINFDYADGAQMMMDHLERCQIVALSNHPYGFAYRGLPVGLMQTEYAQARSDSLNVMVIIQYDGYAERIGLGVIFRPVWRRRELQPRELTIHLR